MKKGLIKMLKIPIFTFFIQLVSLNMLEAHPALKNSIDPLIVNNNLFYFIPQGRAFRTHQKQQEVDSGKLKAQVKDLQTGEPLAGVTVFLKGQDRVQQTDAEGRFQLNLSPGNYELTLTYIGYEDEKRIVQLKDGKEIFLDITMKAAKSSLDEVIVVGYGTKKRATVTGAINQVGAEVFEDRPITSVAEGLQGVIPNLNITFADGQPGRGANYNVRGFTSINGGSPLILIDGIPGDINLINPEDIQNVTALKDASSAAIYGARAAFGVILVTTKSGKKGKFDIRYSNNFGLRQPLGVPEVVDARTNAEIQNEAYKGFSGQDQSGMIAIIDYLQRRKADPSLPAMGVDATGKFINGADIDWYDAFYAKTQAFQKHTLSIAGGSDKINYYLSAGALYQEGTFRVATDDYKRYNLRGKLDFQIKPWLTVFNNFEFSQGNYDAPNKFVSGGFNIYRYLSLAANPYESIKTPDGNWTTMGSYTFGQLQDAGRTKMTSRVIRNTIGFRSKFLNNSLRLNGDYTVMYNQDLNNIQNVPVPYETAPGKISQSNRLNYVQSSFRENVHSIANLYAEYEKALGRHNINLLAGANQELNQDHYFFAKRYDNITSNLNSLNLATGVVNVGDDKATWALRSLFYRIGYNFDNRYLFELNGRYDGTSRFPTNDRWGFFPSVSVGWVVSKENFFKPLLSVIDNLKFRASYGSLGNQAVGAYSYLSTMDIRQTNSLLDGVRQLKTQAPGLVSPQLTWETTTTTDIGADISLINHRLELGFDWYNRQTLNMLTKSRTLPAVLGTVEPKTNAADLSTKGWELSVKWQDKFMLWGKPFDYNATAVLSDNRTIITRYDNPSGLLTDYYTGQEVGNIWGFQTLGFFKTDDEYKKSPNQSKVSSIEYQLNGHSMAGDIKFADLNGDNVIDKGQNTVGNPGDQMVIGNSNPRYSYGLNTNFNFAKFSLNVFFQGIGKRDFWPGTEAAIFWGTYNRWYQPVYKHMKNNYWTPENTDAYFPKLRAYQALFPGRSLGSPQSRYLQNASYLRLKNITLGYSLPFKWLEKIKIGSARVFISGQNLITWTKLSTAFDPEGLGDEVDGPSRNGNGFVYPIQKTFVAGVDINF